MKKRILALLLCVSLCLCFAVFAEEEEEAESGFSFRAMPGYTCFPLASETFCLD